MSLIKLLHNKHDKVQDKGMLGPHFAPFLVNIELIHHSSDHATNRVPLIRLKLKLQQDDTFTLILSMGYILNTT